MRLVYEDIMVRSFELFFNPKYPYIAYVRKKENGNCADISCKYIINSKKSHEGL